MRHTRCALVTGVQARALPICLPAGAARDEMPAVDASRFVGVGAAGIPGVEPVVSVSIAGEARAYPLRILIWHQIVNDRVADVPVVVTYCPMCNAALRSEERRVGKECVSTCRSRWSPYH